MQVLDIKDDEQFTRKRNRMKDIVPVTSQASEISGLQLHLNLFSVCFTRYQRAKETCTVIVDKSRSCDQVVVTRSIGCEFYASIELNLR